jgi:hypothetical protein
MQDCQEEHVGGLLTIPTPPPSLEDAMPINRFGHLIDLARNRFRYSIDLARLGPQFLDLDQRWGRSESSGLSSPVLRLAIERAPPQDLQDCLRHALRQASTPTLMTKEAIATVCDHAQGNPRALINHGGRVA